MSQRTCPACAEHVVPVAELLVSDTHCPACGRRIGVHRLIGAVYYVLIFSVTLVSTVAVIAQFGLFAAILWFPFPIGAIGYLNARFSPLAARPVR